MQILSGTHIRWGYKRHYKGTKTAIKVIINLKMSYNTDQPPTHTASYYKIQNIAGRYDRSF